ncbi:MAG: protein-glutamate O-methyltransferase CheR [Lachnospiraceae bacterium]|nr:protein-glutamate O-methyltransferase CheR [Lachnospiraceae bacterium]
MVKLTENEFQTISGYVRMHYGINLEKKQFLIESKLWIELARCKADNYTDYWQKVRMDHTGEMEQRMIDLLTTNYTYFCREEAHFSFLMNQILPKLDQNSGGMLNIWCAACATGQECYTLAMYLLDCQNMGKLTMPFRILGSDISEKALKAAEKGRYGSGDYARLLPHWKGNYCGAFAGGEFEIKQKVKDQIRFQKHNLLTPLPSGGMFQVIFCRNVLIYFREQERSQLVKLICQSLKPGGYLFTSFSETLQGCSNMPLEYIQPAVYRRTGGQADEKKKDKNPDYRRFQTVSGVHDQNTGLR